MNIEHRYYLIVDLEATCCNSASVPRNEMEIIEIGAVMQDAVTFEVHSEFQSFVRPVRHPILTDFCTSLTNIDQGSVDKAPGLLQVMTAMKGWMNEFDDCLFCSWGNYDRNQFVQDCDYHRIEYPFGPSHLNLKEEFSRSQGLKKKFGINGALRHLGLSFDGSPHRGIDDARNIARIVRKVCTGL